MRNSTRSPIFSDFKSNLFKIVYFPNRWSRGTKTLGTRMIRRYREEGSGGAKMILFLLNVIGF